VLVDDLEFVDGEQQVDAVEALLLVEFVLGDADALQRAVGGKQPLMPVDAEPSFVDDIHEAGRARRHTAPIGVAPARPD
jgi:hypothetical protein